MSTSPEELQGQVERILQSETFHSSVVLRRLLRFLADKTASGEADELKEYAIGIDALGKPPTYDPRQDAIVRLHIGRIRQKLGEYYRQEGKDDRVIVELPKGRFKLKCEVRQAPSPATPATHVDPPEPETRKPFRYWRQVMLGLSAALLASLCWGTYAAALLWQARRNQAGAWGPELEELWQPFIASKRPLVIAIADPLFIGLKGTDVFFRKISLRRPEDAAHSREVLALRKALGDPAIQTTFNFTPSGEGMSSFLLAKLLGTRKQDIALTRASQVLLSGLADNDVILIGPEIMFEQKLSGVQLHPDLVPAPGGIRNLHPRTGEPELFADAAASSKPDDGEVYALISSAPGPLGNTHFASFTSSRTWGRQGAVEAFTDPTLAKSVLDRIKTPSGAIPRCFQVVLKVRFRDGVPVDVVYVTHRAVSSS